METKQVKEQLEKAEAKTDSLLMKAAAGLGKLASSRYSLITLVVIVVVAGVLWFFKK